MQVQNLKLWKTYPFDDYLKMPGYSYSGIKSDGNFITPTKKMQLGTLVHTYLLTPREYNHEQADLVRPIAAALKNRLGALLKYLEPELAITADFIHDGFKMPYKGRLDLCIPGRIVVDIKVTEMPIKKGIEYFGYDKQQSGYARGIDAKVALIIAINPKNKFIAIENIRIEDEWWNYQIKVKGEPIL